MMVFTSRVFYQHETAPPYPPNELKVTYKGLPIQRSPEHSLYSIVPPDGYDVVAQLAGSFTRLDKLKAAIDQFILTCHIATDVFFEKDAPPKRGRPVLAKNKPKLDDLLKQEGTEIEEETEGSE
jgi:hypothetical protein